MAKVLASTQSSDKTFVEQRPPARVSRNNASLSRKLYVENALLSSIHLDYTIQNQQKTKQERRSGK